MYCTSRKFVVLSLLLIGVLLGQTVAAGPKIERWTTPNGAREIGRAHV